MKVSKAYFERFKKEFLYWQKELGLTQYNVAFFHEKIENEYAKISTNEMAKNADVFLCTEIKDGSLEADLGPESHGRHEVIHLLLNRIVWLGNKRYIETSDLDEEWESLVVRLEKVLKHI